MGTETAIAGLAELPILVRTSGDRAHRLGWRGCARIDVARCPGDSAFVARVYAAISACDRAAIDAEAQRRSD
jgi:hypothetical protein